MLPITTAAKETVKMTLHYHMYCAIYIIDLEIAETAFVAASIGVSQFSLKYYTRQTLDSIAFNDTLIRLRFYAAYLLIWVISG